MVLLDLVQAQGSTFKLVMEGFSVIVSAPLSSIFVQSSNDPVARSQITIRGSTLFLTTATPSIDYNSHFIQRADSLEIRASGISLQAAGAIERLPLCRSPMHRSTSSATRSEPLGDLHPWSAEIIAPFDCVFQRSCTRIFSRLASSALLTLLDTQPDMHVRLDRLMLRIESAPFAELLYLVNQLLTPLYGTEILRDASLEGVSADSSINIDNVASGDDAKISDLVNHPRLRSGLTAWPHSLELRALLPVPSRTHEYPPTPGSVSCSHSLVSCFCGDRESPVVNLEGAPANAQWIVWAYPLNLAVRQLALASLPDQDGISFPVELAAWDETRSVFLAVSNSLILHSARACFLNCQEDDGYDRDTGAPNWLRCAISSKVWRLHWMNSNISAASIVQRLSVVTNPFNGPTSVPFRFVVSVFRCHSSASI